MSLPERKFTRREFLIGSSLIAGGFFAEACLPNKKNSFNEQIEPGSFSPEDYELIINAIQPVNRLISPDREPPLLFVQRSADIKVIDANPGPWEENDIFIFIPKTNTPPTEVSVTTCFHETLHMFDDSKRHEPSARLAFYFDKIKNNKPFRTADKVFKESEYLKLKTTLGHPQDSVRELFASALTVLRFYPTEFVSKISDFDKNQSAFYLELARKSMDALLEFSSIPAKLEDLSFDQRLLEYVYGFETG